MNAAIDLPSIIDHLSNGAYPLLGSGSGRRVYDLGDGSALKVARNAKGYAQNQVESIISEMDDSDLFAKVLFVSPDNRYLVMEKADPVSDFSVIRNYFHVNTNRELFQLANFQYIPHKYNLLAVDLCRPANWGLIQSRPVIIDYGFTRRIRRKYYSIFNL
ncbi:hypothetical protein C807_03278 [Lachnospiraceae bacterium 28-4]|jgi:hypothetical protein|nr:hypothetical protein C807_03278 [Lachnospiraceae bacterium 28-4]